MPTMPTSTEAKSCLWCKQSFNRKRFFSGRLEDNSAYRRRKFCSLSCAVFMQHSKEPPSAAAARKRTRKMRAVTCDACGTAFNLAVHHLDENPMNNQPSNHQTLCANCHAFWHAVQRRSPRLLPARMPCMFLRGDDPA